MTQAQQIITTPDRVVGCDGGGGALGHPRVFLTIPSDADHVDCPYCGRRFVLDTAVAAAAGH
ncbi:MAG: zinc-finger domain-containing protein [Alphaproteobacteria bacterium]